nr:hypothetical protein CFP56_16062 [Quercus suber]
MPPKKKAHKVGHVDKVTAPEHGHRQRQERERFVTPDGGEIDEVVVANRIYARIALAIQGGERRKEDFLFGEFHKQNPPTFDEGPDHMAAENWLLKMDKLLRALELEEYVAKFVELSCFASYLIPNESKKVKKFRESLNDRIRPLIIASRVDTFPEAVKQAMSLEEDSKYNPNSKESEKKQGPFNSQHGKGQGHKKGFFRNLGNRGQYFRHSKNAHPQSGDKKSCSRCGKLHDGQNCDGVKICFACK